MGAMGGEVLVGRDAERAALHRAVVGTDAAGAILVGAEGVGKTALVRSLLAETKVAGVRWIQATAAMTAVPFGALAPLLGEVDGHVAPAALLARAHAVVATESVGAVVIDDAHLLDDLSATFVSQLAPRRLGPVVLTARADLPAPDAITRLWRDGELVRIDVDVLAPADVEALLVGLLGGPVERELSRTLVRVSGGNLIFLRELAQAGVASGAIKHEQSWRLVGDLVPSIRLTELLEARLRGLPDDQRRALDLLALADGLSEDLAERLTPTGVLAELEDRRLVVLEAGRVAVSHGTYARVLRTAIGPIKARRLFRALADAVAEAGPSTDHERMQSTRWRLAAGDVPTPHELLTTGTLARQAYDMGLAEQCARELLALGREVDGALLLADVMMADGRTAEVEQVLLAASAAAHTDDDIVAVAEARGRNFFHGMRRREDALRVTDEALARVGGAEATDRLRAHRAVFDFFLGELPAAIAAAEPMVAAGQPPLEARAALVGALGLTGQFLRAFEVGAAGQQSELRVTVVPDGLRDISMALSLVQMGRVREALDLARQQHGQAVDVGFEYARSWLAYAMAVALLNRGRVEQARGWFEESAEALAAGRDDPRARLAAAGVLHCAALTGPDPDVAAARARAEALTMPTWGWFEGEVVRAQAWATLRTGGRAPAIALLTDEIDHLRHRHHFVLEAVLLHDLVRLDAAGPEVAARLRELESSIDGELVGARAAHAEAWSAGDADAFSAAADRLARLGFDLMAAEAFAQAARAARRAGKARAATGFERRGSELLGRCEGAVTPAVQRTGEAAVLTDRELEIASLAAGGRSSRQIADQLFLSPRTVENYLQRVYVKLGVSRRADLGPALGGRAGQPAPTA